MKLNLRNRGIGLLELMLSLSIIAILLVTATRFYVSTKSSQQVGEAAQLVTAVYTAAQSWITHDQIKNQDMIPLFVADGSLPKEFSKANVNPWGGHVTATGQSATSITVNLSAVPADSCNDLTEEFKEKIPNSVASCDKGFTITFQLQ